MIAQLPDTTPEVDRESSLARAGRVIPNGVSAGGRDIYRDVIVRAQGAYLWERRRPPVPTTSTRRWRPPRERSPRWPEEGGR